MAVGLRSQTQVQWMGEGVGIDLIFYGADWIAWALQLRSRAPVFAGPPENCARDCGESQPLRRST